MHIYLKEKLTELLGWVKYDLLNESSHVELPRQFLFHHEVDPKTKTIMVTCDEYPGLYTIARNENELEDAINDAIFTYFGVPRLIARRSPNMFMSETKGDQVISKRLAIA